MRVEAQQVQRQRAVRLDDATLVENAHDRILAMNAGHDRHPQVNVATGHLDPKAAVLRRSPLANVEFGEHFQPRHHLLGEGHATDLRDRVEYPVEAILDGDASRRALEMHIARRRPYGVIDGRINQFDSRARASLSDAKLRTSALREGSTALLLSCTSDCTACTDSSCFDR
jgi:hypothetical protein